MCCLVYQIAWASRTVTFLKCYVIIVCCEGSFFVSMLVSVTEQTVSPFLTICWLYAKQLQYFCRSNDLFWCFLYFASCKNRSINSWLWLVHAVSFWLLFPPVISSVVVISTFPLYVVFFVKFHWFFFKSRRNVISWAIFYV